MNVEDNINSEEMTHDSTFINDKQDVLKLFSEHLSKKGRLPATISSYLSDVRKFLLYLEKYKISVGSCDPVTVLHYRKELENIERLGPNSVRRSIIALKLLFRMISEDSNLPNSSLEDVPIPPRQESAHLKLTNDDIDALWETANELHPRILSLRNQAILHLLSLEGLKATEIIALRWQDYLMNSNNLGSLRITGQRKRIIHLCQSTSNAIFLYRNEARLLWKGGTDHRDYVFVGFKGRDWNHPISQLSRHGLKFALYQIAEKASTPQVNSETLRHYAMSWRLNRGDSPADVMSHFGLRQLGNIAKHLKQSED